MYDRKKVSILIPCYRHENYVQSCLTSILEQTYKNYEVIICDDASPDQSVAKIEEMKSRFEKAGIPFIFFKRKQNHGIVPNINKMLEKASGEYIKIIASDDMMFPNYLEKAVNFLEEHPEKGAVFTNLQKVVEETQYPAEEKNFYGLGFEEAPDVENNTFERAYMETYVNAPSLMYRHELLEKVGSYDEQIAIEDLEMTLRMLKDNPHVYGVLSEPLIYYRISLNSMASMQAGKGARKRIRFMYVNCVLIAKKYKKDVKRSKYYKKLFQLFWTYASCNAFNLYVGLKNAVLRKK